jgi:hypothetical protein
LAVEVSEEELGAIEAGLQGNTDRQALEELSDRQRKLAL